MRFPARIVILVLILFACLAGALTSQAQATLPTPSAPILVVNDSTSSDPYQSFVPELLTTEGLNEFQVAQLSQLTASFLANYDVVVLPHLTLTAAEASMFQAYVNTGGTLVGFRPDTQLASVFGVASTGSTLVEGWVKINTTTAYGTGLDPSVMKFHGTADRYTLGSGTSLATLYSSSTVSTSNPAAVRNQFGSGQAILFAYDLTQTVVLLRQGNPAWAGYPDNHDGYVVMRPSQMFMDQASGQFWNDLGNGALNDVPQADEQMRLFSNAVVVTNAAKRPLPKLWYFPNQQRALLLLTGDHHGDPESNSTTEEATIHAAGGLFSEFMWNPYNVISNNTATSFTQGGDALGVHFNDTAEMDSSGVGGSHVTWTGMQSLMSSSLLNYASVYPNAPAPVTTRNHFLIWLSNNAAGTPDQTAQAELFQSFGIQLDTTFSAFPNRWGYMTGSGLPMKFLNTTSGAVIPVYEQATQYEDDVQLSNDTYSMQWTLAQAQSHYQQSLSDSLTKYNTVVTMLFHPDHFVTSVSDGGPYQPYAQTVLNYAQANNVPMSTTANWLSFWQARTSTAVSQPTFASNVLTFTATGAPTGLTLLVPNASGTKVVSAMTVDGASASFSVGTYQGVPYAGTVLAAGSHTISVTYAAGTATISGTVSPTSAVSSTTLQLQQGGAGGPVIQTTQPAANGSYSFGSLGAGTYVVTPVSSSNTFSPASSTATITTANITGVNFTASPVSNGETLFTTQAPGSVNNTDGPWELGTAFTSDTQGFITAIRFWKDSLETGTHNGHLWSASGQLLASVTFANETASGWQQQSLSSPIQIAANTTYVVSVNTANSYVAEGGGLTLQVVNQDLSSIVGNNGLIGSPFAFPTNSFNGSNYFRDVVFVPTGFALSGKITPATLSFGSTVTLSGTSSATAIVDSNGNYSFVGLPNGSYAVTPSAPGLSFSPASQAVTISSGAKTGINFTALQAYTISGTITPASAGGGATVTLSGSASATTTADANGNFSFTGVANGTYTVTPSKASVIFSPASRSVVINGASGTANFAATQTYSISGTISPTASGAGTTVTLSGTSSGTATADSNGNYTFSGLANGTFTVTPSKAGFTFAPTSQTATINTANDTGINFVALSAGGTLAINTTVSKDQGTASTTVATGTFSTTAPNTLLLAFVSADYGSGASTTVTGITGGSLTWTLVLRTNTQSGTAEVWRAFSASTLTNATVTATLSQKVASSMTVMAFTGVDTTGTNGSGAIGATKSTNANPGAPSGSLTTTRNGSWVLGVGADWDNATSRTVGTGQTMVHQYLAPVGDTYWVQRQNTTTALSGTSVTINDTAPTADRYDLSVVEVLPALGVSATSTISGSISPTAAGSGATVVLNGPESGSTTADVNGNYSFTGVANGSYTLTPSNSGWLFSPASVSATVNNANVTAPAITGTQVFAISGTVSPAATGAGATITMSGPSSGSTTADVNGNYSFTNLSNGNYTVAASKTGVIFTPPSLAVSISGADSSGNNFTAGQTYSISGSITPSTGGSGATVTLSGAATAVVTADSNGNYTFTGLANGSYTVTPTKAGYVYNPVSANASINSANATVPAFAATQVFTISGTLSPAASGTGATVTLSGTSTATTTADANGSYSFTVSLNGPYTVTPTKTGVVFTPTTQNLTINNASATANFTADQTYTITGNITPIASSAGATVNLTGAASATATVDINGNYSFAGLAAGTYTVTPVLSGFVFTPASATVTVSTANVVQNFTMVQGFSISGTISPIFGGAGTNISLTGSALATTTTDSNGNYTFIGLLPGSYTVAPVSNAFTFAPSSATVVISTANTVANFVATSAAGGETLFTTQTPTGIANDADYELGTAFTSDVQGKITAIRFWKASGESGTHTGNLWNSAGQLIASVTFANETLSGWQQQALPSAVSITANTTYTVSVNTTQSTYVATASGLATAVVNQDLSSIVGNNGIFSLTPGTFPTLTFSNTNYFRDVAFSPTAFPISGTVSTAANGAGTTLTLSGAGSGTATADANGNFSFAPMPNGTYTVTPSKSGYIFSPANRSVTVANGAITGVTFTATPIFTISGTITPAATANGSTVTLSGDSSATATVNASGNYSFTGLVAGNYTVTPAKTGFVLTPTSTNVTLSNANVTANFTIAAQTYTISGTITPAASGSGATVALTGAATASTTADSNGNYSFTGLVNGNYTVTPNKTGFTFTPGSTNVTVSNANATANFTSGQTFTITGTITPAASGNGTTVTLSGSSNATTTANSSGVYTFNGIANGSYTVTPSKSGFTFSPTNASVTVNNANPAAVNFTATGSATGIASDITTSKDQGTASSTVVSPTFTTAGANELLLAFVSADNNTGTTTVSGVSGGGLTWTLVKRTNAQKGTAEIWRAFATAKLTNTSVTATLSQSVTSSLTVMAFTGVNTSTPVGATGGGSAASGAPTASLTTTSANSWVVGVGTDWDNAISRTLGASQTSVHQFLSPNGDTYWVQRSTLSPAAGTVVTINDTAPTTDRWDLSICEIIAAP